MSATTLADESEPNDSFAEADDISAGDHKGFISPVDDEDYFMFMAGNGDIIEITYISDSIDWPQYMELKDQAKETIRDIDSHDQIEVSATFYTANETPVDYFYIYIEGEVGGYNFTLTITKQEDYNTGNDVMASYGGAVEVAFDTTITGQIYDLDEEDYYMFSAGNGDVITIDFMSYAADWPQYLELQDPAKEEVWELDSNDETEASGMYYTANETAVGVWYIILSGEMGEYEFTVHVEKQNDAMTGNDVMATYTDAVELAFETTHMGIIYDLDEADYYMFSAGNGDVITIDFKSYAVDWPQYLELQDPLKEEVWELDSNDEVATSGMYYTANETEVAVWYIIITGEMGEYELNITVVKQNDAMTGNDVVGDYPDAAMVETGMMYSGQLYDLDEADYYMFMAGNGDIITIDFVSYSVDWDMYLSLEMASKEEVWELSSHDEVATSGVFYTPYEADVDPWYIIIDGEMGEYEFNITLVKQDDGGSGNDAPGGWDTGLNITEGEYTGVMADVDEVDLYRITVSAGWTLYVNLTAMSEWDLNLIVFDESKASIHTLSSADDVKESWSGTVPAGTPADSIWYFRCEWVASNDANDYTFDLGIVTGPVEDTEPPTITHSSPSVWDSGEDEVISADIVDNVDVVEVKLFFRMTGETDFTEVAMAISSGDTWEGTIPGANVTIGGVEYYIWATDGENEITEPAGGATSPVSVTDVNPPPDSEPPTITMDGPGELKEDKAATFTVTVTDNEDVLLVTLYWRYKDELLFLPLIMTKGEGDEYTTTIPKELMVKDGTLEYYVQASDSAGNIGEYGDDTTPKTVKVKKKDDGPGFGAALVVCALTAALVAASRRR